MDSPRQPRGGSVSCPGPPLLGVRFGPLLGRGPGAVRGVRAGRRRLGPDGLAHRRRRRERLAVDEFGQDDPYRLQHRDEQEVAEEDGLEVLVDRRRVGDGVPAAERPAEPAGERVVVLQGEVREGDRERDERERADERRERREPQFGHRPRRVPRVRQELTGIVKRRLRRPSLVGGDRAQVDAPGERERARRPGEELVGLLDDLEPGVEPEEGSGPGRAAPSRRPRPNAQKGFRARGVRWARLR